MLTIHVLNEDCLIAIFKMLDVQSLANVVTVDKTRHLAAARTVFKRKFASIPTCLSTNDESKAQSLIRRLQYFGDYITKLKIKVPLAKKRLILEATIDCCQHNVNTLMFHYDDSHSSKDDDPTANQWFFNHLVDFAQLRLLHFKYGGSFPGSFHRLSIRLPKVTSLNKVIIDNFAGHLEINLVDFLELNPQIEEFSLWTGEKLYASYVKYISEKLASLKVLDLRIAEFFQLADRKPIKFENLEKLRVVCFHNMDNNYLPFFGDKIKNLVNLDYTAVTTTNRLIDIVCQFKLLTHLKIGSFGLVDGQLITIANNLEKLELFFITDSPNNGMASFTANGVKQFLDIGTELESVYISFEEINYEDNVDLMFNLKQILCTTRWTVLERNSTRRRTFVIFGSY